ncbi:MAG: FAD-dependent oxidoreductase [Campylobacterota bacterium]|nr:FAD-dependent oxidoreductase [Campylobacterota bacterium]
MKSNGKIAVIGGGIAGATISLYLSNLGLDITLFEKNNSLVSGPPICHLHAGGNLYREIDDNSCVTLLKESIDLLRVFPNAIDYRPTILATPKTDDIDPDNLFKRLELLKVEYQRLIDKDKNNKVLGEVKDYYKSYSKDDILELKKRDILKNPKNFDDWMIPFAKNVELDKFKFPIIIVQEYGLNIFRLGATTSYMLENTKTANISLNSEVVDIKENKNKDSYSIEYKKENLTKKESFDYVINSAGFRTGSIDDMLDIKRDSLVEFKSAYVTKWEDNQDIWPEVIFFGKRGTPTGMGQFTPYPNAHFQIHGMTEDITLFKNGLVKNTPLSSQPKLDKKFIDKIDKSWSVEDINTRTTRSIEHIQQYIPSFQNVSISSKPLYGAQQIPGKDSDLRTADVTFDANRYARCEIVKGNSVLNMSDLIVKELIKLNYLDKEDYGKREFLYNMKIDDDKITSIAQELTKQRDYPISLARVVNSKNLC